MRDILGDSLGIIVVVIIFLIIAWFITRELRCWYWKINKRVRTLESIDATLITIQQLLAQGNTVNAVMTGEIASIATGLQTSAIKNDVDEQLPEI